MEIPATFAFRKEFFLTLELSRRAHTANTDKLTMKGKLTRGRFE
jgi:hypothetical protein